MGSEPMGHEKWYKTCLLGGTYTILMRRSNVCLGSGTGQEEHTSPNEPTDLQSRNKPLILVSLRYLVVLPQL